MIKKLASIFQKVSLIIGILIILMFFAPMMFGIMPYIVLSGSMEPNIKTGSVAYINSHVKASEIVEGDIIGFNTEEGEVTHRVVKINSDGSFVTKGDNNDENDEAPVPVDKVKGKTVFSVPILGRIIAFIKSKQGIAVVCAYIFLNLLCIIFDKNIYNQEVPNTFKEAIMRCENLDEIKKVIIEEMDLFKEQILEDVSAIDLKQLEKPKQLLLPTGENSEGIAINSDTENINIERIQNLINANENIEVNIVEEKNKNEEVKDEKIEETKNEENESEDVKNILNLIDAVDEEEIDLDKAKRELVRYDNPRLIELRNNLKEQIEKSKIVQVDFENNKFEKVEETKNREPEKLAEEINKEEAVNKSQKKNRKKNRIKNKKKAS